MKKYKALIESFVHPSIAAQSLTITVEALNDDHALRQVKRQLRKMGIKTATIGVLECLTPSNAFAFAMWN